MPTVELSNIGRSPRYVHDEKNKSTVIPAGQTVKINVHEVMVKKLEAMAAAPLSTLRIGGKPLNKEQPRVERATLKA